MIGPHVHMGPIKKQRAIFEWKLEGCVTSALKSNQLILQAFPLQRKVEIKDCLSSQLTLFCPISKMLAKSNQRAVRLLHLAAEWQLWPSYFLLFLISPLMALWNIFFMETMIGLVVIRAIKTFRKSFWKFGDVRDVYVEHLNFQDLFCRCPSRFWSTNTTSRLKDKKL